MRQKALESGRHKVRTKTRAPARKGAYYIPVGRLTCNNRRWRFNEMVSMVTRKARVSSVDEAEVERFSRHAADWWNPRGPMAALHKFNPVRLGYIRDQAAAHFGRDPKKLDCLKGLRMRPFDRWIISSRRSQSRPMSISL